MYEITITLDDYQPEKYFRNGTIYDSRTAWRDRNWEFHRMSNKTKGK